MGEPIPGITNVIVDCTANNIANGIAQSLVIAKDLTNTCFACVKAIGIDNVRNTPIHSPISTFK